MKAWRKDLLELLLVVLLVPQIFVFFYYIPFLFTGGNNGSFLKTLVLYAFTLSWVSAPFLAVLVACIKKLFKARVRWYALLVFNVAAGYLWVTAWNVLVYPVFSYGRAAFPILVCGLGTTGYALARALYLNGLQPQPTASPEGE